METRHKMAKIPSHSEWKRGGSWLFEIAAMPIEDREPVLSAEGLLNKLSNHGLSAADFGRLTHSARNTVWNWLHGIRPVPRWVSALFEIYESSETYMRDEMNDVFKKDIDFEDEVKK
jgi:hypothetical protein